MIDSSPRTGLVFALVGPSAAGKNTIMRHALPKIAHLRQLPTATTRPPRADEREGVQHFFHTPASFDALIAAGELLEWQWVHGHRYGIPRKTLEIAIAAQDDLVADIEVFGAATLKEIHPDNAVLVFVAPPNMDVLEKRIRKRGTDTEEEIATRLRRAIFEMKFAAKSDYLIINDDLEQAVDEFSSIVTAERRRRDLRNIWVSVRFRTGEVELVSATQTYGLPTTTALPYEQADQTVRRIAAAIGVADFEFIVRADMPGDGIAPAHFQVDSEHFSPTLRMVFECLVPASATAPEGWEWRPLSSPSWSP